MPYWLSFAFWTAERSDVFRNFTLAIAGIFSFGFLVWRAIAADRTSRAALTQAKASVRQIELATRQSEISVEQAKAATAQAVAATKQSETSADRATTELFSRAIDQIGDESQFIRLGAIHTLERIGRDSERDHFAVLDILAGFIRHHAKKRTSPATEVDASGELWDAGKRNASAPYWLLPSDAVRQPDNEENLKLKREVWETLSIWHRALSLDDPAPDVQAALKAIGVRNREREPEIWPVDLSKTDLRRCSFSGRNYTWTVLSASDLRGSSWNSTVARLCDATAADFSGTLMTKVDFSDSTFRLCNFNGARLENAKLTGVSFDKCTFDKAILIGADLTGTKGVSRDDLKNAIVDENTRMPGADLPT